MPPKRSTPITSGATNQRVVHQAASPMKVSRLLGWCWVVGEDKTILLEDGF